MRYGFMERPNVPEALEQMSRPGLRIDPMETTYFLGRERLLATDRPGMMLWRERLFAWISRNARPATYYFRLPTSRVVELGTQIEL
jgi:KUP system potassium uptake protein